VGCRQCLRLNHNEQAKPQPGLISALTYEIVNSVVAGFVQVADNEDFPIHTEYTIPEHSFPQRIAAVRRASRTNDKRLLDVVSG
jgi:hypothetical protein